VSSTYDIMCLSCGDRAVRLGREWHSSENGRLLVEAVLLPGVGSTLVSEHPGHDLVGGAFSYPLVEVYCSGLHHPGLHPDGTWVDVKVLRLVQMAHRTGAPEAALFPCWPRRRLARLHAEMGIEPEATPPEAAVLPDVSEVVLQGLLYQAERRQWVWTDLDGSVQTKAPLMVRSVQRSPGEVQWVLHCLQAPEGVVVKMHEGNLIVDPPVEAGPMDRGRVEHLGPS
jgi:hypothetical protein